MSNNEPRSDPANDLRKRAEKQAAAVDVNRDIREHNRVETALRAAIEATDTSRAV